MNWTHAEPLDIVVLGWAAGLLLLALADGLLVAWNRWREELATRDDTIGGDWCERLTEPDEDWTAEGGCADEQAV